LGISLLLGAPLRAAPPPAPRWQIQKWLQRSASLRQLRGKVVLLEFFQIVCPPCEAARPEIEALQRKYRDQGLRVVAIAAAFQQLEDQTPELIEKWAESHSSDIPVGIDGALEAPSGELPELRATFDRYGADATPYLVAIDRRGRIRGKSVYPGFEETENFLVGLLKEAP
jgi:thiol-disulfide isomerase/thioredoxin